jgi:hypothetical protein
MDATKALSAYLRLRARRERLAHNPPDAKGLVYERFTEAEGEQLRLAETELNRLNGAPAIELLIANRSSVLAFIK